MKKSDIGLIGLGVMGSSLAQNIESRGFQVSVYNRHFDTTKKFAEDHAGRNFLAADSIHTFIQSLKSPRKIVLMVKAGAPVDDIVEQLIPNLDKGDIIIDGGNSFYKDTQRRERSLKEKGIDFVGCGVSGGEEGALKGPSIMPGGTKKAYNKIKKFLEPIAARDFTGGACVSHLGSDGAGHYIKMVHNGIEYGVMQLIAESYELLHKGYGMDSGEIAEIFDKFNKGKLNSFLMEISVPVLRKKNSDKKDDYLINDILDTASQKGTGKWASIDALDRGVAIPTITQAVYSRYISAELETRKKLNSAYKVKLDIKKKDKDVVINLLRDSLYLSIISCFAQGFALIEKAAKEEGWKINRAEISRIWQGGCIIRAKLLGILHKDLSLATNKDKEFLLLPTIKKEILKDLKNLRKLSRHAVAGGVPVPAFTSSLFYIEAMVEKRLPANVIQGLRDYFGAHTYQRISKPGIHHTNWLG